MITKTYRNDIVSMLNYNILVLKMDVTNIPDIRTTCFMVPATNLTGLIFSFQ